MASDSSINWSLGGTFASMPAAGYAGRIYVATDSPVQKWYDNGSSWQPVIMGVRGIRPPLASSLTAQNQTTNTLTDKNGCLTFSGATGDAANSVIIRSHTTSLTNVNTAYVEAAFSLIGSYNISTTTYPGGSVLMRESSSGKFAVFKFFNAGTGQNQLLVEAEIFTSFSNRSAFQAYQVNGAPNCPMFMGLRRSGTNLLYQLSYDRVTWDTIQTTALSSIFTSAPDQCGIGDWNYNQASQFDCLHFTSGT